MDVTKDKGMLLKVKDLKDKELPFKAKVEGGWLGCYRWEHGDRLLITKLLDDLDGENNEYLWLATNLDKSNAEAGVATWQIKIDIEGE